MKRKIYATGNENISGKFNVSYYIVEKSSDFLEWLGLLLTEVLGMENGEKEAMYNTETEYDNEDNEIGDKLVQKNIKKMIDLHESYNKEGNRIDLFYGSKRVYITFRKSKEVRKKLASFFEKTVDWIEVEQIKIGKKKVIKIKK